jgi:hypothetical protein
MRNVRRTWLADTNGMALGAEAYMTVFGEPKVACLALFAGVPFDTQQNSLIALVDLADVIWTSPGDTGPEVSASI